MFNFLKLFVVSLLLVGQAHAAASIQDVIERRAKSGNFLCRVGMKNTPRACHVSVQIQEVKDSRYVAFYSRNGAKSISTETLNVRIGSKVYRFAWMDSMELLYLDHPRVNVAARFVADNWPEIDYSNGFIIRIETWGDLMQIKSAPP